MRFRWLRVAIVTMLCTVLLSLMRLPKISQVFAQITTQKVTEHAAVLYAVPLAQHQLKNQEVRPTDSSLEKESEARVLIAEVVVEGVEDELEEIVYRAVQTQPGSVITRSQLQEDINAVFATGYFANVQAIPEDIPAGVRVTFEVEPNSILTSVQIEGKQVLPQSVIDEAFSNQYGNILNLRQFQGGIEVVKQWYLDNDYALAQIVGEPRVENGVVMVTVVEGVIEDIQVRFQNRDFEITDAEGNPIPGYVLETDVLAALALTPGNIFHKETMVTALRKVFDLAHFDDIWLSLEPGQDPRKVSVIINILERPGAGYNESPCPQKISAGYLQEALTVCQAQSRRYQQNRDYQREYYTLVGLGKIYAELGQYQQAMNYFQQSLQSAQSTGNLVNEANASNALGMTYYFLGQFQQAIEHHQQALGILQAVSRQMAEASQLSDQAGEYFEAGQHQQAIALLRQSLNTLHRIGDYTGEALLFHAGEEFILADETEADRLDENSREFNRYQTAIDHYRRNLNTAQVYRGSSERANVFHNLGNLYISLGRYDKAIEFYNQSLEVAQNFEDRSLEAAALDGLGMTYRTLGQPQQAIELHQQALNLNRETSDRISEANVLSNLGVAYRDLGEWNKAEQFFLDSIELSESLRVGLDDQNQISIFDKQSNTYRSLQQVLIAQGKTDQALEIAERSRARAFVDLLSRQLAMPSVDSSNQAPDTGTSSPDINQIKQIARDQNATLVTYSIFYDSVKTPEGSLSYPSELIIWVIKPTGEVSFRPVDLTAIEQVQPTDETARAVEQRGSTQTAELSELVNRTREAIGAAVNRNAYAEPDQRRLLKNDYRLLIKPIADLLPTEPEAKVIFIPQGGLFLIPFAALQDENGTYLIEKHTILTAPSIQVLEFTHEINQRLETNQDFSLQTERLLIVGNPTMPAIPTLPGRLPLQPPPLPGAEQEALEIARMLNTEALIGPQATETTVVRQMSDARIVHLATHGFLDYGQPSEFGVRDLPGAVVLAPSSEDDGLLTASEILDLDLRAELVVLSACDTGSGRITGDGVIGLARSLIAAGTPSVVVSLWQVPDDSTAMLMTEFYRQLQQ
ncbi:MAG: CHAT domain-containing protein, partial [Cyanobacteria bacterium P01_G01_bin.38]